MQRYLQKYRYSRKLCQNDPLLQVSPFIGKNKILKMNGMLMMFMLVGALGSEFTNPGCEVFDSEGVCVSCLDRYYINQITRICFPVNPLCNDYDQLGSCTSCYEGFQLFLQEGQCYPTIIPPPENCIAIGVESACLRCEEQYVLFQGQCYKQDPNCQVLQQGSMSCQKCVDGHFIGDSGECEAKEFSHCSQVFNWECLACDAGYQLVLGVCYQLTEGIDLNCVQTSAAGQCTLCELDYLLTADARCVLMSPLCLSYDLNALCTDCEEDFQLVDGACYSPQFLQFQRNYDPNCHRFDEEGVCTKCSWGFYFNGDHKCTQVSSLCRTFSLQTGLCLSCYEGYDMDDGDCVVRTVPLDPYCSQFEGSVCLKCSGGAWMNGDGVCVVMDPKCRTVDDEGVCSSCYPGYRLNQQSVCEIDREYNCLEWDDGACSRCPYGYYLDAHNKCNLINELCARFDYSALQCIACYKGYVLYQGQCIDFQRYRTMENIDPNCDQVAANGQCLSCLDRFYLKRGTCTPVSPYCKAYHQVKGYCTSCYLGYYLDVFGQCVMGF